MRFTLALVIAALIAGVASSPRPATLEPTYVGIDVCLGCHQFTTKTLVTEYMKTGHANALSEVSGAAPTYPENTSPTPLEPPSGTSWSDFAYVIGGYGWKARFVMSSGSVYTAGADAQQNVADGSRVPYHMGEDIAFDYTCFRCHTTAPDEAGSWNGNDPDALGTFLDAGVTCEACHGPGSDHAASPGSVKPPNVGEVRGLVVCQGCHSRDESLEIVQAADGFIRNQQQAAEFMASQHGNGDGVDLQCATCHDPHVATHYPNAAGDGQSGFKTTCQTCHPTQQVLLNDAPKAIECVDCHMPKATKSALGGPVGNGLRGDVASHVLSINPAPVSRDAMFTPDGSQLVVDGEGVGALTLDFVCLGCHTDKDLSWAGDHAPTVHSANGMHTASEAAGELPTAFGLGQNYPNPFNPSTSVDFSLPQAVSVTLKVYDTAGRLLGTVVDQTMPAGFHSVTLDAGGLATGVYLYELRAGEFTATRKMVVSK